MLDPRVSLAAERTLLSCIGLGAAGAHLLHDGGTIPGGIVLMIGVGVALPFIAAARYRRSMKRLNAGLELAPNEALLNMVLVSIVGLVAGGVALWLVLGR